MSSQAEIVPFRRKRVWFKVVFVILWLTTIISLIIFGGACALAWFIDPANQANYLTGAYRAGLVCFPAAIALGLLLKFRG